jgi:hypothetical protein
LEGTLNILGEFIARTKELIASTYQSISVKQAAALLGLSETEASKCMEILREREI